MEQVLDLRQHILFMQALLAFEILQGYSPVMTDKQAVIDALSRLPEAASLEEITEELHLMAAVRRGRADIAAGRSKGHEEVTHLVDSGATTWTSR
jgi:predicted transcriptional regulator